MTSEAKEPSASLRIAAKLVDDLTDHTDEDGCPWGVFMDESAIATVEAAIDTAVQAERERLAGILADQAPSHEISYAASVLGLRPELDAAWDERHPTPDPPTQGGSKP